MKNLEVGTKVDFYEVVSYKNGIYTLTDGYNTVTIDMEAKKIAFVERNNRCFKAERYTKSFNFLINSIEELEAELVEEVAVDESLVEEVENLNDDLFQEEDIEYAEEAIEREICDLQDKIVNIDESSIGRVVGMRAGKYRIVLSTGKLVELNRNEFYLDNEEPNIQDEEAIERETFNTPVTYDDFIKLPKEERKEIVRARVGEEIDSEYLNMICKSNYRVMVNGKDIYECYFTELGVRIFRYGKHPKQCKIWSELKDHVSKIQVVGTI